MNKEYYLKKFSTTWNKCETVAQDIKRNGNTEDIENITNDIFKEIADADAAVGYYLARYGKDAYDNWVKNICGLKLTTFGKRVDSILTMLFVVKNDGKDIDISSISSCTSQSLDVCEKNCPRYSHCDTIAIANDILTEYEKENLHCETSIYFFTFGSSEMFPYQHGYVKVVGTSKDDAIAKFRSKYPDKSENTVNCAFIYTDKEWLEIIKKHSMGICRDALI